MRQVETSGDPAKGNIEANTRGKRAMLRVRWAIAGCLLGFAVTAWAGLGRERHASSEEGGGSIHGAIQSATWGLQDTTAAVGETLSHARDSVQDLALQSRIASRLGDDKTLDSGRVEVMVTEADTVVLSGLVPDQASKAKVVALTRDTRGVTRVVDQLAVTPPPRVIHASTPLVPVPTVATRDRLER